MSELQSVRIENLTGGWNTLASKNSMAPNQGIVCRNWIPFSNGSIGPRYGSVAFDSGSMDMVAGQTLGMFQAYLSNGGRRLLFFTHTDKLNTLGGGANTNYTFIREYDPSISGWRNAHQIRQKTQPLVGSTSPSHRCRIGCTAPTPRVGCGALSSLIRAWRTAGSNVMAQQAPPAMSAADAVRAWVRIRR